MTADGFGRSAWRWAIVVSAGVLLSLRFGFNFGIGNHNTYLLHALRRVHPDLLTADWLASSTQDYHPVFTHIAALLLRLDESGWLFALVNVLCITLCAVVVYLIVRELVPGRLAVPVFLLTAAFMGVGATYSAGGSYLLSSTLQPSTVAVMGCLLAILWFVRERTLASGICLAVAGAFHVNFAVLVVPWFGLAHLLLGWRGCSRRLVLQLAPVCATLALLSPLILGQAGSPHVEQARYIFQHVLAPQHYVPATYWTEFVVYFGWCALGLLAGRSVLFASAKGCLGALWLSSLLLVTTATLLTTVVFIPTVSQLYFWRLAPFTVLASQIAACAGLLVFLDNQTASLSALRRMLVFAASAIAIWLLFRYHYGEFRFLQYGLLIALAVVFAVQPLLRPLSEKGTSPAWVLACGAWLLAAIVPLLSLSSRSSLLRGRPQTESELYAWVATTPRESVFLIPPQLENFRFNARRAVVVDNKSTPVEPGQLLEWYGRLGLVCGEDSVQSGASAAAGYAKLDSARVTAIEARVPIHFVVVLADQPFSGTDRWRPVYELPGVRVYGREDGPPSNEVGASH